MWCIPHPTKPGHTLVLLDTEGLGDVEKGDSKNDTWIFALAVLLSSTLVYNSVGTIDQDSLEKLHYVTELSDHIKVKSSPTPGDDDNDDDDESGEFKRTFPSFIWCIRDFCLKLEHEGKTITEDEYLQNALMLKKGNSMAVRDYNFPRECIKHFFHSHKCFVFERPASAIDLQRLEQLSESQLDRNFVEKAKTFCNFVYQKSKAKTLAGGHVVTGRMLGNLAVTYVESIRSGAIPCMENAVLTLTQIENTAALHEAVSIYEAEMAKLENTFPTETQEEFMKQQREYEKMAVEAFMKKSFKDDKQEYQSQLMHELHQRNETFSRRNEDASEIRCSALLQELSANLEQGIANGLFCKSGGHKLFMEEKRKLVDAYNNAHGKGIKANETLQKFIEDKKTIEKTIMQADETLTKSDIEREENRIRRESEEQKLQIELENSRCLERMHKDQAERFEQQANMLKEKMEQERFKMMQENEWMIEQKLKEKEAFEREQFHDKARIMTAQIQDLRKQNEKPDSSSIIDGITNLATTAAFLIPHPGVKVAALAATLLSPFLKKIF
ncbi:guanylate-binding protein 7-like [Rhinophrynus dorsalis]